MTSNPSTGALATVQSLYAAFGRGDVPGLLDLLAEDVQWRFIGDEASGYRASVSGKSAVAAWFGTVAAADDIQVFEPREFLAGADHVTVLGHERTVARTSGRVFECDWVHVFALRDGRIARFLGLLDTQAAGRAR